MNEYKRAFQNFANFNGRATRREYWMFLLFNILIGIACFAADIALMATIGIGGLNLIYMLAALIPGISVTVRRLHDTGRSGWWILVGLVPLVGLLLLVFMCMDSEPGTNQFGANPKAQSAGETVEFATA